MKIFLAITLYNDQIHGKCSESILKNSLSLMNAGHTVKPYYGSDLYIDRSRNICAELFLKSDCDRMVFIDSDLEFDDDAILKLIKYDKPLIAGIYRYKKDLEEVGVIFSGMSKGQKIIEIAELKDHPFMLGTQFHPEFQSWPLRPHPLFQQFMKVVIEQKT